VYGLGSCGVDSLGMFMGACMTLWPAWACMTWAPVCVYDLGTCGQCGHVLA